jgi:hypothetical protein
VNKFLNKFSNTNNLAETICLSIIFYIVLTIIAVLIGLALTCIYETKAGEIPSVIASMLAWSATLITPIIAILLINSWKSQKSYEVEKEYASLILKDLHPILIGLVEIKNIIINLQTIDKNLVLFEKFLNPIDKNLRHESAEIYSNIKIYSRISNNKNILDQQSRLEHHCMEIMDIYKSLINDEYKKYYNIAVDRYPQYFQNEQKPNYCKKYPDGIGYFRISIGRIRNKLNQNISIDVNSPETNEDFNYGQYNSFEELLKATRRILENIEDQVLESIKVNN